jgi:hypothetical protein
MNMRYAYWHFRCKTDGCNFPILVTYIGPYDEGHKIPPITGLGSIELHCPSCGQAHDYKRSEATVFLGSQPPGEKP